MNALDGSIHRPHIALSIDKPTTRGEDRSVPEGEGAIDGYGKDESSAYAFFEHVRWPDGPVCPHCEHNRVYFLEPKDGISRTTRTGARTERRVFKCARCRKQFSVTTGTYLHGTRIPLRAWHIAIVKMSNRWTGATPFEIARHAGITLRSGRVLVTRIEQAIMENDCSLMMPPPEDLNQLKEQWRKGSSLVGRIQGSVEGGVEASTSTRPSHPTAGPQLRGAREQLRVVDDPGRVLKALLGQRSFAE